MTGKSTGAIYQAFAQCRAKSGIKVMICVGTRETQAAFFTIARTLVAKGENIHTKDCCVNFPNKSKIIIHVPESVTGTEVHEVWWEDYGNIDPYLIEHYNMRARLK